MEYGYSCMGYEISGALGVKLAIGDGHEVYAMVGDGSFIMLHSELLTAVQEHKKINICVFDNASFGCINNLQVGQGNRACAPSCATATRRPGGMTASFISVDFAAIAARTARRRTPSARSTSWRRRWRRQSPSTTAPSCST